MRTFLLVENDASRMMGVTVIPSSRGLLGWEMCYLLCVGFGILYQRERERERDSSPPASVMNRTPKSGEEDGDQLLCLGWIQSTAVYGVYKLAS